MHNCVHNIDNGMGEAAGYEVIVTNPSHLQLQDINMETKNSRCRFYGTFINM